MKADLILHGVTAVALIGLGVAVFCGAGGWWVPGRLVTASVQGGMLAGFGVLAFAVGAAVSRMQHDREG